MKMIVSILTVICVFSVVSGQNNKYYSNSDTIFFPDSVNPLQSPRITAVSKSRSLDEIDNSVQKSLLLAKEMNKLDSLEDFLGLVSGIPESEEMFFVNRMGGERSSAIKPKPAKCMVELQSVSLVPENHDPSTVYIPSCTRIKRCGGCCNHSLLSCQPVRNTTETRNFEVLISKIDISGKLKYAGKKVIPLDEHTQCECSCKIKPEHCSRGHTYSESECQCICKNTDEEEKCVKDEDFPFKNGMKMIEGLTTH
ncbi:vascular endothelial growth factor A-A-like isoform X2 [Chelonus insularis]|uniref:vascular endothelial growth factor A-A-like isoform X2 n=1 Tax=Chelonus insularis TaxID=460826 RepID=UPI00158C5F4C|nr:vascular endothelial growth factor A-A-like isoform X2 [Chelonus insularis]